MKLFSMVFILERMMLTLSFSRHDHSEVSTIYCSIIPNNAYIVYATAKDGECVHQLVSQTLTVKGIIYTLL